MRFQRGVVVSGDGGMGGFLEEESEVRLPALHRRGRSNQWFAFFALAMIDSTACCVSGW
jgi:hypothetical protein